MALGTKDLRPVVRSFFGPVMNCTRHKYYQDNDGSDCYRNRARPWREHGTAGSDNRGTVLDAQHSRDLPVYIVGKATEVIAIIRHTHRED